MAWRGVGLSVLAACIAAAAALSNHQHRTSGARLRAATAAAAVEARAAVAGGGGAEPAREKEEARAAGSPPASVCPGTIALSIIMASRNDDYGGHGTQRLSRCLSSLLQHDWAGGGADAEVIIVSWNTIAAKPSLQHALRLPAALGAPVRFIDVPSHVAARARGGDKLPLLEYHAKNVGLRRARGRHVLFTNGDCLYPQPLLDGITRDVAAGLPSDTVYAALRRDLNKHQTKCVAANGWPWDLPSRGMRCGAGSPFRRSAVWDDGDFLPNVGDFLLAPCGTVAAAKGFAEVEAPFGCDSEIFCALTGRGSTVARYGGGDCALFHQHHRKGWHTFLMSGNATNYSDPWHRRVCNLRRDRGNPAADAASGRGERWGLALQVLEEGVTPASGAAELRALRAKRKRVGLPCAHLFPAVPQKPMKVPPRPQVPVSGSRRSRARRLGSRLGM